MKTHAQIDERSLAMARAIVAKIDHDPARTGLAKARATCERWYREDPSPAIREWLDILEQPWEKIREVLLDESEAGRRLRQSDPFCGMLTPQERWKIYRLRATTALLHDQPRQCGKPRATVARASARHTAADSKT